MIPKASLSGFQASLRGEVKPQIPVKTIATLVLIAATIGTGIYGCGYTASTTPTIGYNPTPAITTIMPNSAVAGGAAFTLTINGTNFVAASMVNFGGAARTTTFVSATQLTAAIPAAAIASGVIAAVTVINPAANPGTSNAVNFTITGGTNPVPTINFLDPSCAPSGAQAFTLAVFGSNFVAGSVVRWNGNDRPAQFSNSGEIDVRILASDIATTGTAAVTVFNAAPGGGSSNTLTLTITAGSAHPQSIAVDPTGKFAYVASEGCPDAFTGNVSMYTIDPTTGALKSIGALMPGDWVSRSVTVDPSGKFAYVANSGNPDVSAGSISMYAINPTSGALISTGMTGGQCPAGPLGPCAPVSLAVHPSGKFAYVLDESFAPTNISISMYTINAATGFLGFEGTVTGGLANSVAVHPSGKFAYVTNPDVSMYTINVTTGALTLIGTIAAGLSPRSIAIDPSGKFAYVAISGSIEMYIIDASMGTLTSIGPIAAGTGPVSVAVDPTGKFVYAVNSGSNDVSVYTINTSTGVLTFVGARAAGPSPTSIAITPSGKFAYVTNSGSNSVSMYSIDAATGALTLIGTIGT